MNPFFTIITPTIQRESLLACCDSVNAQTFKDFRHTIQYDIPPTGDFGNHARRRSWERATGDWIIYLDDDNVLAHEDALQDISEALEGIEEKWAIFPIILRGDRFFNDPPGLRLTDTANMVIRREVAQWPDGPEYEMDGIFCDMLKANYPYRAFPDVRPIINVPVSQGGR